MEQDIRKTLSEFAIQIEKDVQFNELSEQDLLNKWTSKLISTSNEFRKETPQLSFKELYSETLLAVSSPVATRNLSNAIPTGFKDLDQLTGGLPIGQLIVLGARPAMGKSSFLISVLTNAIKNGIANPIAFFSLEMSAQKTMLLLLSKLSEISYQMLVSKELPKLLLDEIQEKTKIVNNANISIEENCFTIEDIITQTHFLVKEKGVQLILIDYLQLIKVKSRRDSSREAEVAKLCRELKALARKYNIAILVTSQLSRAVESRGGDKRPQLFDLRESGAIEQDADKVLFLHRPEYYGITEDMLGESTIGIAEIIVAKNRDGAMDTIKLKFESEYSCFKNSSNSENKKVHDGKEYFKNLRTNEFEVISDISIHTSTKNDIEEEPF